LAETDREENINPDTEGEEIVIEGPEEEKKQEEESAEAAEEMKTGENPEDGEPVKEAEESVPEESREAEDSEKDTQEDAPEKNTDDNKDAGVRLKLQEDKFKKQIDELTDRLKRSLAEFDNFRKRTDKEKSSMYEIGARDIVEKILPVLDNFERGLASAPEGDKFAEGIQMIYKQLVTALTDAGVKPIEAVGKPFDPELHNAVMHVEDAELGENIVVEEFQKGYLYRDHVVRHSMVKVAN
jgi:molecular chaperone GrpE